MNEHRPLLLFVLEAERYALALAAVQSVVHAVEITPLPQAPASVAGLINVRGQIVPVYNMRHRFHLPERDLQLDDHIILANTPRRRVALVVDAVTGVIVCDGNDPVPVEAVLPGTDYVAGVVKRPDGLILIHDLDTFLSPDEEQALEAALAAS